MSPTRALVVATFVIYAWRCDTSFAKYIPISCDEIILEHFYCNEVELSFDLSSRIADFCQSAVGYKNISTHQLINTWGEYANLHSIKSYCKHDLIEYAAVVMFLLMLPFGVICCSMWSNENETACDEQCSAENSLQEVFSNSARRASC